MTTYRVYVETNGPRDWVEYVEAESEQHAKALVEDDPNDWAYLAAIPLPAEMHSECVCSNQPVLFKRVDNLNPNPDHTETPWTFQCQGCYRAFVCPPDEIDWEAERQAESQEDDWHELPTFWRERGTEQEDARLPFSDPYYEDDVTLELED